MDNILYRIPHIRDRRADGMVQYLCSQCRQNTIWIVPPSTPGEVALCENCGLIVARNFIGKRPSEEGNPNWVQFFCDRCEEWAGPYEPDSSPGYTAFHACKPKIKVLIDGQVVRENGCWGSFADQVAFAALSLKRKSRSDEGKKLAESIIQKIIDARNLEELEKQLKEASEAAEQENLATGHPSLVQI